MTRWTLIGYLASGAGLAFCFAVIVVALLDTPVRAAENETGIRGVVAAIVLGAIVLGAAAGALCFRFRDQAHWVRESIIIESLSFGLLSSIIAGALWTVLSTYQEIGAFLQKAMYKYSEFWIKNVLLSLFISNAILFFAWKIVGRRGR